MAELITWSPRVGAAGDDLYRWPEELFVVGGGTLSLPPSVAQVNGCDRLFQLAGEITRRNFMQLVPWSNPPYPAIGNMGLVKSGQYNQVDLTPGNLLPMLFRAQSLYFTECQHLLGVNPGLNSPSSPQSIELLNGNTNIPVVGNQTWGLGTIRKYLATDYYAAQMLNYQCLLTDSLGTTFITPLTPNAIGYSNHRSNYQALNVPAGRRMRNFINIKIPVAMASVSAVKLAIRLPFNVRYTNNGVMTSVTLEIWKTSALTIPSNANWANSDTVFATPANKVASINLTPAAPNIDELHSSLTVTLSGSYTPGATYGFIFVMLEERSLAYGAGPGAAVADCTLDETNNITPTLACYP